MSSDWKTEKMTLKASLTGPDAYREGHISMKAGGEISAGTTGWVEMIDTFDRPGDAYTKKTYASAKKYADAFKDESGKRIPKAGVCAGAGVGHARAEWSIFDAEAKGPNASAGLEASAASLSAGAFAKAEVASASATAGPVKATVGLALDTGASVGLTGVEAKVLGTGFSFGRKMEVSVLGNSIECSLM